MTEDGERRDAIADFEAADEAFAQELRRRTRDDMKGKAGDFAFTVWLMMGAYHFWVHPTSRLLSWQAAVYFIIGALAAAVFFGWLIYGMWRLTLPFFVRAQKKLWLKTGRIADRNVDGIIVLTGRLYKVILVVIIYFAAGWALDLLYNIR